MVAKKRKSVSRKYYSKTKPSKNVVARRGLVVLFLVVIAAVLLFGLYKGLTYTGSLFFSRNPYFELQQIEISSDGRLSSTQLREYAGVQPGVNLFEVDFDAVRERLAEVPLIESVTIQRKLPDTLTIRVIERVAVAQIRWSSRGIPLLVDRHGVVLPATRSGGSLPLINGLKLDGLTPGTKLDDRSLLHCLDLLAMADQLGLGSSLAFNSFDLRYPDFITVVLNGETSARFPHHSAREKLIRLVSVLQLSSEQGRRVKTVDLTPDGRNVPVTFY